MEKTGMKRNGRSSQICMLLVIFHMAGSTLGQSQEQQFEGG